jgi:hypothetical protein
MDPARVSGRVSLRVQRNEPHHLHAYEGGAEASSIDADFSIVFGCVPQIISNPYMYVSQSVLYKLSQMLGKTKAVDG